MNIETLNAIKRRQKADENYTHESDRINEAFNDRDRLLAMKLFEMFQ